MGSGDGKLKLNQMNIISVSAHVARKPAISGMTRKTIWNIIFVRIIALTAAPKWTEGKEKMSEWISVEELKPCPFCGGEATNCDLSDTICANCKGTPYIITDNFQWRGVQGGKDD